MTDNGEWHTVHNSKSAHIAPASANSSHSKNNGRRKSRHGISVPAEPKQHQQHKKPTAAASDYSNPFHTAHDDDDSEEEEEDDQIDPIDLPVPPYHISILISCPFEDCELPAPFMDTTALMNHLKEHHKLVFKNLHHMYMALDAYLDRWAKELKEKPISEFAELGAQEEDVYVLDPEKCALDLKIRGDMQRAKLNEVLKTQQNERDTESKVARKCLFCKIVCENRAVLFKHMFTEHNFNIGLPDNLVNATEFLNMLETKLSNLQCLYCEKTFTNAAVLRKHMRKKKHFKIAPKNRQYDRFYVINYLEPGKNWENFENDNYESDDEKRDESWADWEEDIQESTMCLFDTVVLPSPRDAFNHMSTEHNFDMDAIRKEKDLDFYQTIVLINYIRHKNSLGTCFSCEKVFENENDLTDHLKQENCIAKFVPMDAPFWKDSRYFAPTYENDPLLTGFEAEDDMLKDLSDDEANKKYSQEAMQRSLSISKESGKDKK